jgi:CheY-like chemotaxis protein
MPAYGWPRLLPAVLVVDDSAYARRRLRRFLLSVGFHQVVEAADGDEAEWLFREHQPKLVLLDQVMRGRTGLEMAKLFMSLAPLTRILMLTVVSEPAIHFRARQAGIVQVLGKSDWDALRSAIDEVSGE